MTRPFNDETYSTLNSFPHTTVPTTTIEGKYRVYVPGRGEPRVTHDSYDAACAEAQRICVREGKRAYVMHDLIAYESVAQVRYLTPATYENP